MLLAGASGPVRGGGKAERPTLARFGTIFTRIKADSAAYRISSAQAVNRDGRKMICYDLLAEASLSDISFSSVLAAKFRNVGYGQ